jgi:hypothetical protein
MRCMRSAQGLCMTVLASAVLFSSACLAHAPSVGECAEGSDFIHNAALARDNGTKESSFLGKIREDIELIQSFPPSLRWFVQDDDDAEFLIGAASEVFQRPRAPDLHRSDFLKACLARTRVTPSARL